MKNLSILAVLCLLSLVTFSAPSITYTPIATNCTSGNRTIDNVTISDATGVQTNGNAVPKVFYRKSGGGAWFSQNGTLTSGNNSSGTWSFTIVTADMGTLTANDVIEYFIAAQNTAASPSVGSHPSGIVGGNMNSITTYPPSPNSYKVSGSPAITTQPVAQVACSGSSTNFSVVATGVELTYQWRKNGTDINGATTATLSLTNVSANDAGNYDVVVSGTCNPAVTSNAVALTINEVPAITTQPTAQSACNVGSASFSVVATGTGITYQWRKNGSDINGATTATLSLTNVSANDAGNYDVAVSGTCTPAVTSNAVALTINAAPAITTQPTAQSSCDGGSASFSVVATGTGITYQWRKNGTDINGATTATLSLTNIAANDAGNYDVVVSGTCSPAVTSNAVALTINAAPAITTQPTVQSACAGGSASFSVVATGTGITYQWRKNGTDINGATTATLSLTNIAANDAGNYDVVVSGTCSPAVTSNAVALTINAAPVITTQPSAQSACAGGSASFSVAATGTGITYQWRKNGTDINGATTATLSLTNIAANDAANYDVVVSGTCSPAVTSNAVALTINAAPAITTQPTVQSACDGGSASFSVVATGTGITYQWRKNGTDINGATTATLSLTNIAANDAGNYDVVVSGTCTPAVTSNAVALTINEVPAITTQPTAQSACNVGSASFSVVATGTGLSYQWRKNGSDINGATTATLSLTNVSANDAGNYDVAVSGTCTPAVTSNAVALTINAAPAITTQPTAQSSCDGGSASFTVVATGTGLTYQWRKNGTDINGATSATLSLTNVSANDAGNYDVAVSGTCTPAVTSNAVALTINAAPAITTQPTAQSSCDGGSASFTVVATGTGLTYQWRKNGTDINGATSATLELNNVSSGDETSYDVVISNTCNGSVTSNPVSFTLKASTNISTDPESQVVCPGKTVSFSVVATGSDITYQWMKNGGDINGATNSTYTISNAASSDAGNYSVKVTGCNSVTSADATLNISTANSWLGTANSNWNNSANWCTGIPTATNSITIPIGTPYSPVISGNTDINNITVTNGALLTVAAGGTLNLYGNIINSGTFDVTAGTIVLKGATAQTIPVINAANVIMDGAGGMIANGNIIVGSTLTLNNGNIILGDNNITLNGSANGSINSHIVTNGTGSVISKNITTAAVIIPVAPNASSYNPVTIANGDGKDFTVSVTTGLTPSIAMDDKAINRTWKIVPNAALSANADITLQFAEADANSNAQTNNVMDIGVHNSTRWVVISSATGVMPTGSSQEKQVSIQTNQFGPFAITSPGGISYPTAITNLDKDITTMQLMPNIVSTNSVVKIVSKKAMKIDFVVTDATGRTMMKFSKQIFAGENIIPVNLDRLGNGNYLLRGITVEGGTEIIKFIKIK